MQKANILKVSNNTKAAIIYVLVTNCHIYLTCVPARLSVNYDCFASAAGKQSKLFVNATKPAFASLKAIKVPAGQGSLDLQAYSYCLTGRWQKLATSSFVTAFHAKGAAPCQSNGI